MMGPSLRGGTVRVSVGSWPVGQRCRLAVHTWGKVLNGSKAKHVALYATLHSVLLARARCRQGSGGSAPPRA